VRSGQYDDDVSPAMRILFDEGTEAEQDNNKTTTKKS